VYDSCDQYTEEYFRSLIYVTLQILIASEVLILTFTKNDKKHNFTEKDGQFFCFLGNVSIDVYTDYIQKVNNFHLAVCTPSYCLKH